MRVTKGWLCCLLTITLAALVAAPLFAAPKSERKGREGVAARKEGPSSVSEKAREAKVQAPDPNKRMLRLKYRGLKGMSRVISGGVAGGPENDDCSNSIEAFDGELSFDTTGAITDGEPNSACNFFLNNQVSQDIWFHYFATCSGNLSVSLCGSGYDTKLAVYDSMECTGDILACNDDSCGLASQLSIQATQDNAYMIRVGGYDEAAGPGTLTITCGGGGGDAGETCAQAGNIFDGVTEFSTTGSTTDGPGNALCNDVGGDNQVNQDIWFNYTATCSETLNVSLCGSEYDTKLALYEGTSCVGSIIACNDDSCGLQSQVSASVTEGETYKIRVGGYMAGTGDGSITVTCSAGPCDGGVGDCCSAHPNPGCEDSECCSEVCACDPFCCDTEWDGFCAGSGFGGTGCGAALLCEDQPCFIPPPTNDLCDDAILIEDGATPFSTFGTSTDGPGDSLCIDVGGDDNVNQDIWFNYVASCDGNLIASLCGSAYDTKIALYDSHGCVGDILACNDDSCGLQSVALAEVFVGQEIKIRIGGFGGGSGMGTLNVLCAEPAGNDACEDATEVTDGDFAFSTFGASTDGPPDGLCDFFGDPQVNNDVWFNYTATCSQTLMISLCGSFYDTKMAVYDGTDCVGDILACNDDSCGLQSRIMTTVTEGQSYKIRVGGFGGATGTGTMTISCGAGPCDAGVGDCCAAHPSPGCEDSECCTLVCSCDPFCCETEWDGFCAGTGFVAGCGAALLCENQDCFIPPPENDACEDAIPIFQGATDYSNVGTTTDGENPLPGQCEEGFGLDLGSDVWFTFESDCNGTLIVSTCNTAGYDSRLALYEGCSCTPTGDSIVGCNDDGATCGLTSEMEAFISAGNCYLLRVGGFGDPGAQGVGTLNISCDEVNPACLGAKGDCFEEQDQPGCNDLECCDNICDDQDPFCCDVEWDLTCAGLAGLLCTTPVNDECENAPIEELPFTFEGSNFNADPDCGLFSPPPNQVWLAFELDTDSSVTLDYCGTDPSFGNAWLNLALGCPCSGFTEGASFDTATCGDGNVTMTWQCLAAGVYYYPVLTEPGSEGLYTINVQAGECIDPCAGATGDCFTPHPTPGCDNSACCNLICDIDPFCCGTEWDFICVDEATDLCNGVEPPANDLCANSIDVSEGTFDFTTIGSGTDGPALPMSCDEGFGLSFTNDVWFDYTPATSGNATISLCDGAFYDSRISLYQGCNCPASNATMVGCNDDGCGNPGTPSTLTVPVVGGTCYKLRVGGFDGATGEGFFDIFLEGIDCPGGSVTFTNPPAGVVDARQTGTPGGAQDQGISSISVTGPAGAPAGCWALCETGTGGLSANSITNVVSGPGGAYTLTLSRPITAGAVTTIRYLGNDATASYTFHPANANGDSTANSIDILRVIDYLNGVLTPPWGLFSTDIDRSGMANPADILRIIDLLNGAGNLAVWNGTSLPANPGICP